MNINQLESLICIAKRGSMTNAAEELFVSQSALTQQVNSAERELGFKLFDRDHRGTRLTERGAVCLPFMEEIVRTYRCMLASCAKGEGQSIAVGGEYEEVLVFSKAIAEILDQDNFAVQPNYHASEIIHVHGRLSNGDCEMCFTAWCDRVFKGSGFEFAELFRSPIVCFLRHGHPLLAGDPDRLSVEDLRGCRVLLVPKGIDNALDQLRAYFASYEPEIIVSDNTATPFVPNRNEESNDVIIAPAWRLGRMSYFDLVKVPLDWGMQSIEGIAYREPLSPIARDYLKCAKRAFLKGAPQ